MFKLEYFLFYFSFIVLYCEKHQINVMSEITYSQLGDNERCIKFYWENFGIQSDEIITQVQIEISTKKIKIGNWQGQFATSLNVEPYWYSTENMMHAMNDCEGTITWNIPENIRGIIKHKHDGVLQFGIWWIDCDSFLLKSIAIITNN